MLNKRVVGLIGIRAIMSNWNADFSKFPKSTLSGEYYGSDKALKYAFRNKWYNSDEKVLMYKTYKNKEDNIAVNSLKERYENLFNNGEAISVKDVKTMDVVRNAFECVDVKNFGGTILISSGDVSKDKGTGINVSITGAVQIGQGLNKYKEAEDEEVPILSPFSVNDKDNSTLGSVVFMEEAHYLYPFTINGKNYNRYKNLGYTDGYTEEDYNMFKETALNCVTALNTCSKEGCENELAIFIETDENVILPNLQKTVTFHKEYDYGVYKLGFDNLLNDMGDRIKSVEIYYNSMDMKIEHNIANCKVFDIYTRKELV